MVKRAEHASVVQFRFIIETQTDSEHFMFELKHVSWDLNRESLLTKLGTILCGIFLILPKFNVTLRNRDVMIKPEMYLLNNASLNVLTNAMLHRCLFLAVQTLL